MNIVFACDLDNTLLYSFKKKKDGYICIEINKGKEQGFMTGYTYSNFIAMTEKVKFVPVTTRSVEQYRRITFPRNYVPEYALVSNGATLLHNGEICADWEIAPKEIEKLRQIHAAYCNDERFTTCRIVDDSFVYVCCAEGVDNAAVAAELAENCGMDVEESFRKIYFFPENLSKGIAVKKLADTISADFIVAAGDSPIDLSMLDVADVALIPSDSDLKAERCGRLVRADGEIFSDFVISFATAIDKLFIK